MHSHDHNHDDHHHHHHEPSAAPLTLDDSQASCSVTGDIVDKGEMEEQGFVRTHGGQTYYFCCATCVKLFDANPDKYVSNVHESSSLTLLEKLNLVDNVWAFRFTPDAPLSWIPGQFIRVELPHDNTDTEGAKRWFTISSTPHDGYVQITTRITDSSFKRALNELSAGDTLSMIEQPDGDFVWEESSRPLVFIAGGIGVTPFYSMLKSRGHSGKPVDATLVYNGRDRNLPFMQELEAATERHKEFKLVYAINEQLSFESLSERLPDLLNSTVYLSGPEPMVEALSGDLTSNGLSKDNLRQDFFPNYTSQNY